MIIHGRVRFEFSEVSATRLVSRSLNLSVLCLVRPNTCWFFLWRAGNGFLAIPAPHRPWHDATALVSLPSAKGCGRAAHFVVGRPPLLGNWPFWLVDPLPSAFGRYFVPAVLASTHFAPPPHTCMEGFYSCLACFVSFARVIPYKGRPSPPSSRVTKKSSRGLN
mgnify:CR=1 FL=1